MSDKQVRGVGMIAGVNRPKPANVRADLQPPIEMRSLSISTMQAH